MTILPTDIEDKLNSESFRQFCNNNNINLAVFFGSRVKGMARANSDYDLAFLMDKNHYTHDRLAAGKIKGALIKDICSFFETSLVDLVLLNKASPFLKFQIARTGKPVFEKYSGCFAEFASLAVRQHEDARLFRQLGREYLRSN